MHVDNHGLVLARHSCLSQNALPCGALGLWRPREKHEQASEGAREAQPPCRTQKVAWGRRGGQHSHTVTALPAPLVGLGQPLGPQLLRLPGGPGVCSSRGRGPRLSRRSPASWRLQVVRARHRSSLSLVFPDLHPSSFPSGPS